MGGAASRSSGPRPFAGFTAEFGIRPQSGGGSLRCGKGMQEGIGRRCPRKTACSENVQVEVGENFFSSSPCSDDDCISVHLELNQHFWSGSELSHRYIVFPVPKNQELNL